MVPLSYAGFGEFSEGLAPVLVGRKWGYVDHGGNFTIEPDLRWAHKFREGLALVKINSRRSFIDHEGEVVLQVPFAAGSFIDGMARVAKQNLSGWIDRDGNVAIPMEHNNARDFSEGLARVDAGGEHVGLINTAGELVIPHRFQYSSSFRNGLALARTENEIGYIDRTGEFVWKDRATRPWNAIAEYGWAI